MVARKKLLIVNLLPDAMLRARLDEIAVSSTHAEAMRKDCHLIEGALATDRCIASLDERARMLFANASHTIGNLRPITWVNPGNESEEPIRWLLDGASSEKQRYLNSFVAEDSA